MAARGTTAKNSIIAKLNALYGKDFAGIVGGKAYVWENDGDEKVQIAIALTCPKTPVGEEAKTAAVPDITPEEQEMIEKIKRQLRI